MKKHFLKTVTVIVLTILIFSGCSKVPQAEIDAANTAIDSAKISGAELYLHDDFVALQDSMSSILVGIEAQKSKFIKSFSQTKEDLKGIVRISQALIKKTETRKEELRLEIQNTITDVKSIIEKNRQLVLEAPKGKEGTSALIAIKDELNVIEITLKEANTMLEGGEYFATLDKVNAAKEKANAINGELTEVIAKYKSNVKNRKG